MISTIVAILTVLIWSISFSKSISTWMAMDASSRSCSSYAVSLIISNNCLFEITNGLVGTDPTMEMVQHLVSQGKIFATTDAWTFFPYQPFVELGVYDDVWRFIHHNPGEWGCPFQDVMNFLERKLWFFLKFE